MQIINFVRWLFCLTACQCIYLIWHYNDLLWLNYLKSHLSRKSIQYSVSEQITIEYTGNKSVFINLNEYFPWKKAIRAHRHCCITIMQILPLMCCHPCQYSFSPSVSQLFSRFQEKIREKKGNVWGENTRHREWCSDGVEWEDVKNEYI